MPKRDWEDLIIQKGYETLAKVYHPDMPGGTKVAFQELAEAKDFLLAAKGVSKAMPAKSAGVGAVHLDLEMVHVSALLGGHPIQFVGPQGAVIELALSGGPGQLVAEVLTKLMDRYVKPRKR